MEEACFPPSVFEWEPNPVILAHLRGERLQSQDSGPSTVKNTPGCHLVDTAGETEGLSPDMAVAFDEKGSAECNQKSPVVPRHTGPTTISPILSSFACTQCIYVAKKRSELKYAVVIFLKSTFAKWW